MSFLNLFSGPSPGKLEVRGDALFAAERWGEAALAYERALEQLDKRPRAEGRRHREVIAEKRDRSREALAREHQSTADRYLEGGYTREAREFLLLAMEISGDGHFRQHLNRQLDQLGQEEEAADFLPDGLDGNSRQHAPEREDDRVPDASEDETFFALCQTLPPEVKDAYLAYGDDFKAGYLALNAGDFNRAADELVRAMSDHPDPGSYIALELATAYANLGNSGDAEVLLESVVTQHPDALPAYELLCDIYLSRGDFEGARALLANLPPTLDNSTAAILLRGETLHRSGHLETAGDHYRGALERFGWNEAIARALAGTYEAMGDRQGARRLYGELMGRCNTCRSTVDPAIRHRYAELAFADGLFDSEILEHYLLLARDVPDHRALYFNRISRIYAAAGNDAEAGRFATFAEKAGADMDEDVD